MAAEFKDAESEGEAILAACLDSTTAGNVFEGPCGEVQPINGGVNEAGCLECKDSFLKTEYQKVADRAGKIEFKHQSIFLTVDSAS